MNIAWPWLLALLPLYWLLPTAKKSSTDGALEHAFLMSLAHQIPQTPPSRRLSQWLPALIWLSLILACIRPQWIGDPIDNEANGRSLYLSVDLSESMLERDMTWNGRAIERYQAVQAVVGEFVESRKNDFIGLVVFGSFAEIQSPLTPDTLAIKELLADLRPGMAEGSTAIGDGLALAVKQLRESDSPDKVIILLSDGENNSGSVTPEQATQVAVQSGIKVYTIGFGSDGSNSIFGRLGFGGNGIDEATLKDIAEQTQGQYFRATSTSDLIDVFNLIEQLEPSEEFQDQQRVVTELYWLPLSMALLLLALQHFFPLFNRWVQTR